MKAKTKLAKLCGVLLALVMIVGMLPATALATETSSYSIENGTLVISGTTDGSGLPTEGFTRIEITSTGVVTGGTYTVDVDNYDYLEKYGENMYNLLDGGNRIATDAKVEQGVLETSNVNVVNEMVNMITIQRAYEANQKVITSIDSTLDRAVNNVGRVQ